MKSAFSVFKDKLSKSPSEGDADTLDEDLPKLLAMSRKHDSDKTVSHFIAYLKHLIEEGILESNA